LSGEQLGPVEPEGPHTDENLTVERLGPFSLDDLERLRTSW
jgi:hypothetical protein